MEDCKTKPAPSTGGPLIPGDSKREAEAIRTKRNPAVKTGGGRFAGDFGEDRDTVRNQLGNMIRPVVEIKMEELW